MDLKIEHQEATGMKTKRRRRYVHTFERKSGSTLTACIKERKKAVKEDAREKRKHKIPKADKKRKIKNTRS